MCLSHCFTVCQPAERGWSVQAQQFTARSTHMFQSRPRSLSNSTSPSFCASFAAADIEVGCGAFAEHRQQRTFREWFALSGEQRQQLQYELPAPPPAQRLCRGPGHPVGARCCRPADQTSCVDCRDGAERPAAGSIVPTAPCSAAGGGPGGHHPLWARLRRHMHADGRGVLAPRLS